MAGSNNRQLPPLNRISVAGLGLSQNAHRSLIDSGFRTIGHLFRPTEAQREALAFTGSPQEFKEINMKLRHFCRCYQAVKRILAAAIQPEKAEETLREMYVQPPVEEVRQRSHEFEEGSESSTPTSITRAKEGIYEISPAQELVVKEPNIDQPPLLPESEPRPRKRESADYLPPAPRVESIEEKIARSSPFYEIEMELRDQLGKVDLIGEIAVEEEQFRNWCRLVRKTAVRKGRPLPERVPPALFITLMVFTARYSKEEVRNFWGPYTQMVWGLEATPHSLGLCQRLCRERFKETLPFLSQRYGLFFPQKSAGDLVRPVYRHAIIPAYLEREFVRWLRKHWREILETPEGFLIPQLRQEHSLKYIPPTLRNFILDPDTTETAAALIRSMATASDLFAKGESLEEIHDLLSGSPIEQSLWDELSQVYVEEADARERRRLSHRLEWVWNLEVGEMQLRLRNMYLPGRARPYQIVWVEEDVPPKEAAAADVYELLDPWQVDEEWLIDEVVFASDGPPNGVLMLLDDDDSLLCPPQSVPHLPEMSAQFFRLTQQELYAVPIAPDRVQSGNYLVALQPGVALTGPDNESLTASSTLSLPFLLSAGFQSAGFYDIELPLSILRHDRVVETLTEQGTTTSSKPPYIFGADVISGLSRRVPPLYRSDEIWLVIPGASERLFTQGVVELRPQNGKVRRCLLRELEVEKDEDGALRVPLRKLLDRKAGGVYTVELRRGLRSLLQAPLQFSYIPGFEAVGPPERPSGAPVYTPTHLPIARLRGIDAEQLGRQQRLSVTQATNGWLEVTWRDLRNGCRLSISVNDQQVPLEWSVSYFFAWIEPGSENNVFTWSAIKKATLHAAGTDEVDHFVVSVDDDGTQKRQLSLNRRGRARITIQQDQLLDMLRQEHRAEVTGYISVFSERWPLFTVRRHPQLDGIRVQHDAARELVIFENNLKEPWPGEYRFQVQQLSNPSATSQLLQTVQQLEPQHLIPCQLPHGIYQFEVWDLAAGQPVAKEIFGVGEVERSAFFKEAVRLLESLSRDTAHRLPRWLGGDMIRFLAAETERTEEGQADLATEWLWQLALLQPRAYAAATDEELEAVWSPLLLFRQIHDVDTWESQHGMLPDWVVVPYQVMLRFVVSGNEIIVEPEVVSRRGKRGIGYTFLKMSGKQQPVYVRWEPHYREQVVVYLGLPEKGPDKLDYVQLDEWAMYSVYQCQRCGWFVDSKVSPEVVQEHLHGHTKAILKDVWIYEDDNYLLAEITPVRREDIRDYRLPPEYFVDRRKVLTFMRAPATEIPDSGTESYPLAREAYLYASACWVARYRHDLQAAQALQTLVGNSKQQKAFNRLANYLTESKWFDVGAWGALGRFLHALPYERHEPLLNVDRYTLLLALIARTRVHKHSRESQLREQLGLNDAELAQMLQVLNRYCPELVTWAFNWIELFFVHALA